MSDDSHNMRAKLWVSMRATTAGTTSAAAMSVTPSTFIDATVFGSVLGVTRGDVVMVVLVALFTATVVVLAYRSLLFTTFDPEVAEVSGVNVGRIDAMLMLLLSFAILASMKVLGVTLIAAALVVPAVVARMLTNSFARMLWLSSLIGALCGLVGMYLSYHLDVSS
ncbi:MAG: metal ABC transporter permease, partial [Actinobacteria bacterium]|nr:metal ABC transporter permease [Actinomycetota bacterium]